MSKTHDDIGVPWTSPAPAPPLKEDVPPSTAGEECVPSESVETSPAVCSHIRETKLSLLDDYEVFCHALMTDAIRHLSEEAAGRVLRALEARFAPGPEWP